MTPVEIRESFNELLNAYKRSWHQTYTRQQNAKHIMNAIQKYPYLLDQIPWDVFDIARNDVNQLKEGAL